MRYYYLTTSSKNNVKVFNFDSFSDTLGFIENGKLNYTKTENVIYFYDEPVNPSAKRNIEKFLNDARKRNEK